MRRGSIVIILLLVASPVLAQVDNTIGVYTPVDCTTGEAVTHPGGPFTLSVCLNMNGYRPDPSDVSGVYVAVRLRVVGFPESWNVDAEPNPEAGALHGDPLTEDGGELIAPIGEGSSVLLYTLTLYPASITDPVVLEVTGVGDGCPLFRWIGDTVDGAPLCADTSPFTLTVEPLLPVEGTTWSRLKARYGTADTAPGS